MEVFVWFEMLGIGAFALSGAQVAMARRMDIFGVFVWVPLRLWAAAFYGTDSSSIKRPVCLYQPWAWAIVGIVCLITSLLRRPLPVMLWTFWDALGLGAFVVGVGAQLYTLQYPMGVFLMGSVLTGIGGGMLRDILAQRIPVILRRDIYAVAGLVGALGLWFLLGTGMHAILAMAIALAVIVGIRMVSANTS